jgi:DNA gyrase subunit B
MFFPRQPDKLHDLTATAEGQNRATTELILVEGDSAAKAVIRLRDSSSQAVLPMQGKPINAWKATPNALQKNPWMCAAIDSIIGTATTQSRFSIEKNTKAKGTRSHQPAPSQSAISQSAPRQSAPRQSAISGLGDDFRICDVRYDRIVMLFDPDADGIHCGALMLMFFYRWMRPLLESGRVVAARPPLYELTSVNGDETLHAFTDEHYRMMKQTLDQKQIQHTSRRYRGLASMNDDTLVQTCLNTATRRLMPLGIEDAEAAIRVFAPNA